MSDSSSPIQQTSVKITYRIHDELKSVTEFNSLNVVTSRIGLPDGTEPVKVCRMLSDIGRQTVF